MLPLAERLAEDGFEVIIPSLPGVAFSAAPDDQVRGLRFISQRIDSVMRGLGHGRYLVHGGDHVAVVADWLAVDTRDRHSCQHDRFSTRRSALWLRCNWRKRRDTRGNRLSHSGSREYKSRDRLFPAAAHAAGDRDLCARRQSRRLGRLPFPLLHRNSAHTSDSSVDAPRLEHEHDRQHEKRRERRNSQSPAQARQVADPSNHPWHYDSTRIAQGSQRREHTSASG
jgi:hypothetical protein